MTVSREQEIETFLMEAGWEGAERSFLSGDASFRHYDRVRLNGQSAVLMDAPPDKEPVEPFLKVGGYLLDMGFAAPSILAKDNARGLLLLGDLGDYSFTKLLQESPKKELDIYKRAMDVLVALHRKGSSGFELPSYNRELLLDEALLFVDWYLKDVIPAKTFSQKREQFIRHWNAVFDALPFIPDVMVLRDYHADNLMYLSGKEGLESVGLLDFQDAVLGSPAYDVASLLEDARRDLQPETVQIALNYYLQQMEWDKQQFMACYSVLAAQRNTKIIGIFNRLNKRDGKPRYLDYLPRVWQHLEHDIMHPLLRDYREWLQELLPSQSAEPTSRQAG